MKKLKRGHRWWVRTLFYPSARRFFLFAYSALLNCKEGRVLVMEGKRPGLEYSTLYNLGG